MDLGKMLLFGNTKKKLPLPQASFVCVEKRSLSLRITPIDEPAAPGL